MNRRTLLKSLAALTTILALPARAASAKPRLVKSNAEWKQLLPSVAYAVLFEHDTERPGSSILNAEKRSGNYVCAACNQPLFDAAHKYESGTGWPSFYQPLPSALGSVDVLPPL